MGELAHEFDEEPSSPGLIRGGCRQQVSVQLAHITSVERARELLPQVIGMRVLHCGGVRSISSANRRRPDRRRGSSSPRSASRTACAAVPGVVSTPKLDKRPRYGQRGSNTRARNPREHKVCDGSRPRSQTPGKQAVPITVEWYRVALATKRNDLLELPDPQVSIGHRRLPRSQPAREKIAQHPRPRLLRFPLAAFNLQHHFAPVP